MIYRNTWSFLTVGLTLPIINEVRKLMQGAYAENEAKKRLIKWSDTGRDFLGPICIEQENIEDYKSLIGASFRSPAGNMTVHIKSENQVCRWIADINKNKNGSRNFGHCPFVPAFPGTGGYYVMALSHQFSGTNSISFPTFTSATATGTDPCIILCSDQEEKLLFPDGNTRFYASKKNGLIQNVQNFAIDD